MVNQYTYRTIITKEELEDLYCNKRMTYKEIANRLNISIKIIFNRMKKYNIKPREQFRREKNNVRY